MELGYGITRWSDRVFIFAIFPGLEFYRSRCPIYWSVMFNWFNFYVRISKSPNEKSHPNQ